MPIQPSSAASRVLRVLEHIAEHQPVGVRTTSKALGDDKSAVHRAIRALAEHGWIVATNETLPRWRISPQFLSIAVAANAVFDLRHRCRPVLRKLRDRCGETVVLVALDETRLIIAEVFHSPKTLRWMPPVGTQTESHRTAGGRAILPHLPPNMQAEVLGGPVDAELEVSYRTIRNRGFSISDRETSDFSASDGAAIVDANGCAYAAVTIVGPSERLRLTGWDTLGALAMEAASTLSASTAQCGTFTQGRSPAT